MQAVEQLAPTSGTAPTCAALGVARATLYRHRGGSSAVPAPAVERGSPRALDVEERQAVLATLHSERFIDQSPAAVYARLLDEGRYLCSQRTMYRLLEQAGEVRERRDQLRHPVYAKPETVGEPAERGVVVGYNEALWASEVELLLPVRAAGHLQPLRRGVDGGAPGVGAAGEEAHRRERAQADN
jgi:hypothetical protein